MIAGRRKTVRHPAEQVGLTVKNGGDLAVHQPIGSDDLSAEVISYRLVPEANAQDGLPSRERPDDLKGDTRPFWRTGPRQKKPRARIQARSLFRVNPVFPKNTLFTPQRAEIRDKV